MAVLRDMATSLKAQGFTWIFLLGDSGGSQRGMAAVAEELTAAWAGEGVEIAHIPEYYNYGDVLTSGRLSWGSTRTRAWRSPRRLLHHVHHHERRPPARASSGADRRGQGVDPRDQHPACGKDDRARPEADRVPHRGDGGGDSRGDGGRSKVALGQRWALLDSNQRPPACKATYRGRDSRQERESADGRARLGLRLGPVRTVRPDAGSVRPPKAQELDRSSAVVRASPPSEIGVTRSSRAAIGPPTQDPPQPWRVPERGCPRSVERTRPLQGTDRSHPQWIGPRHSRPRT